mmetsp:Transcript_123101/g.359428  ORF Transcript_123101/g.359428 Transcript_123101/m.359428 type:complete len:309 (+) Transcript_123101:81-1007(+)
MVKRWIVKNHGKKSSFLRKEPTQEASKSNVMRSLKNGDVVFGEYMHVRRASTEEGYIKVRHIEQQCGTSWRIRNADGSNTTLLRKQPIESHDATNTVGYATEGEVVVGEFVFVTHKDEKRGGYVKLRHLRAADHPSSAVSGTASAMALAARLTGSSAAASSSLPIQRWTVLDSGHDGAWLRKQPQSDTSKANVECLLPNGEQVVGEFVYVRRSTGELGFVKFKDLRAEGKAWRIQNAQGSLTTVLRRKPLEAQDAKNLAGHVVEGERVEGEFVYVIRMDGRRAGYVRRRYLAALAPRAPTLAEPLVVS